MAPSGEDWVLQNFFHLLQGRKEGLKVTGGEESKIVLTMIEIIKK